MPPGRRRAGIRRARRPLRSRRRSASVNAGLSIHRLPHDDSRTDPSEECLERCQVPPRSGLVGSTTTSSTTPTSPPLDRRHPWRPGGIELINLLYRGANFREGFTRPVAEAPAVPSLSDAPEAHRERYFGPDSDAGKSGRTLVHQVVPLGRMPPRARCCAHLSRPSRVDIQMTEDKPSHHQDPQRLQRRRAQASSRSCTRWGVTLAGSALG